MPGVDEHVHTWEYDGDTQNYAIYRCTQEGCSETYHCPLAD